MKRTVRDLLIRFLARRGFVTKRAWEWDSLAHSLRTARMTTADLRGHLRLVLDRYGVDLAIDVGANRGQFRDALRDEVGFAGPIVSFEPLPALAEELRKRAADSDPRWRVSNSALGASAGTLPLKVMEGTDFSSFLDPTTEATDQFAASNRVRDVVDVPVARLDDELPRLVPDLPGRRVLLKLDTQGYDLEVLRGAERTLDATVVLLTELSFVPLYEEAPIWRETVAHLEGRGFSLAGFFPLSVVHEDHRIIEADAVFVAAGACPPEAASAP